MTREDEYAGRPGDASESDGTAVREAESTDRPRLRAIQSAALAEPWPELLETGVDGPPLVLVLETDRVLGYALIVAHESVAYLAEIAVAPGEHGRGYGSYLLETLLARLRGRGIERVRLTARADDERVRSFYRSFDFEVVERMPDRYEDGDGVVLARDL